MPLLPTFCLMINWVEAHLLACPFKGYTGLDCPGCGFQRSVLALVQGDVRTSFHLFPASVPILLLLAFVPVHLKFEFREGAGMIKFLYLSITVIIVLNYIYKIYTHNLY